MVSNSFINKQIKIYKSLDSCYCKALQEKVIFNAEGLHHLMYDNRNRPRKIKERVYRLALVDYLKKVIESAESANLKVYNHNKITFIWILSWVKVDTKDNRSFMVKVILRKIGNGRLHFLSVMRKQYIKKHKQ